MCVCVRGGGERGRGREGGVGENKEGRKERNGRGKRGREEEEGGGGRELAQTILDYITFSVVFTSCYEFCQPTCAKF